MTGLRHVIREAVIWVSVILSGFALFYVYGDQILAFRDWGTEEGSQETQPSSAPVAGGGRAVPVSEAYRQVVLHADRRGHFSVRGYVNGAPVTFLTDTGATLVALTHRDARAAGVTGNLRYTGRTRTANGVARVAPVTLARLRIGDILLRDVTAVVAEPGKLHVSLLGMSFLGRLSRFEMRGRSLVLVQ